VELFQAEWCPHSHKVRQKLTELGVDFRARQVEANPDERESMVRETGTNEIPVLVIEGAEPLRGEDAILAYLDQLTPRADAEQHRAKAREEVRQFAEVA
jgi:glutathione S-transferase